MVEKMQFSGSSLFNVYILHIIIIFTDKWVSTLHRVILMRNTDDDNDDNTEIIERRQSIAFFCNINGDAIVEPIPSCIDDDQQHSNSKNKYTPITASEYLLAKHYASMKASGTAASNEEEESSAAAQDEL